jgi:hypothetical protein
MSHLHTIDNVELYLRSRTIVDPLTNCWLYQGTPTGKKGHCQIQFNYNPEYIHRISAHLHLNYDLNSNLQVNHKRECPNGNCWNPEHLYIGTQAENMDDLRASDILKKTFCTRGHLIDGIRLDGRKYCKECKINSQIARRQKEKEHMNAAIEWRNKK